MSKLQTERRPVNGEADPDREALRSTIAELRREVERLREAVAEPDAPEFLTVEQVADRLSLSERSVRSYLSSGELPSVTFGRARRIPVDGLRAFIQERLED